MLRRSRVTELSAFLIASVILAGFGWAISRNSTTNNQTGQKMDTAVSTPKKETPPAKESPVVGSLLLLKNNGSSRSIISETLDSKQSKTLYTDSDEKNKIVTALGVRSNEALIIENSQPLSDSGSLVGISLDGKATKKVYQEEISASFLPVLNPKNDTVLTVSFSPVEKSFGFSFVIENIDGTNPSVIAQNIQSVISPSFSPSGDAIVYAGSQSDTTTLYIINVASGDIIKKSTIDGIVLDTRWHGKTIYISLAPKGNATSNKASLALYSEDLVKNSEQISDKEGAEINVVPISDTIISFARALFPNGIPTQRTNATITLFDSTTKEFTDFDQAEKVIGYIHE